MNTVYYLCESDNPKREGLVFVKELNPITYSLGNWYIEIRPNEKNPTFLDFDAIIDNNKETLILNRIYRNLYSVELSNIGTINIRLIRAFERHKKYVGTSKLISSESKLFQVVPISVEKIETLCRQNGFYFIGKNDNDIS